MPKIPPSKYHLPVLLPTRSQMITVSASRSLNNSLYSVLKLETLTAIPKTWPVPRAETAYLLDLTEVVKLKPELYCDDDGKPLSMVKIIQREVC